MPNQADLPFTFPRGSLSKIAQGAVAYDFEHLPPLTGPRVLDIGAGVGAFAVLASQTWPGARITCYEPRAKSFSQLEQNLVGLPVDCRPGAIDESVLPPCDVLKIDGEGSDPSILARYEHLAGVAVLLVGVRGEKDVYFVHRVATGSGLTLLGRHVEASGATTLRFTRLDAPTRADALRSPGAGVQVVEPDQPIQTGETYLHLYVALVTGGGQIWGDVEHCLHELHTLCRQTNVGLTLMRESTTGVDRARNRQSERCLEQVRSAAPQDKPTHMLQLDDDIVFDPRDILKLMRSDMDVTAIVYPRKEIDWERVARVVMAGVSPADLTKFESPFVMNFVTGQGVRHPEIGSLLEVEEAGTGCLMIKVDALAKYIAAYEEELEYVTDYQPRGVIHHQIFHCERDPGCPREETLRALKHAAMALRRADAAGRPQEAECAALLKAARAWSETVGNPGTLGRYLTEDYSFCRRWRLLGGKIYALREAELGHIGNHVYRGRLATALPAPALTPPEPSQIIPGKAS